MMDTLLSLYKCLLYRKLFCAPKEMNVNIKLNTDYTQVTHLENVACQILMHLLPRELTVVCLQTEGSKSVTTESDRRI